MGALRMAEVIPEAARSLAVSDLVTHADAEPVIAAMRDAEAKRAL